MRVIKGYLCLVTVSGDEFSGHKELLFGPQRGERFEVNNMAVFEKPMCAASAGRELLAKPRTREEFFSRVDLVRIEMIMAETEGEMEAMHGLWNLVVVQRGSGGEIKLLGPPRRGIPTLYPLPAALLSENGYTTFGKGEFNRVLHLVREVNRQAALPATISTFVMTRLRLPRKPNPPASP